MYAVSLRAGVGESDEGQCARWAGTRRSSGGTADHWDVRCRLREWETDIDLETIAVHHTCICLHQLSCPGSDD